MESVNSATSGYFRMPNTWLRLKISPGAKVLLAHFCSAANVSGSSWYSYEQLTDVVGRSKASISTYVKELREAGIIETREQKTANGYNYRLLISIKGWADLLRNWSKAVKNDSSKPVEKKEETSQKIERSVQPDERNDPTGHIINNHQNNTTPTPASSAANTATAPQPECVVWTDSDEREWRRFRTSDRDPAFTHGPLPSSELIDKMRSYLAQQENSSGVLSGEELRRAISHHLDEHISRHRLIYTEEEQMQTIETLAAQCQTSEGLKKYFSELKAIWHPSWKRLSSKGQIVSLCQALGLGASSQATAAKSYIARFSSRIIIYEMVYRTSKRSTFEQAC